MQYRTCKTVHSIEGRYVACELEHIDDPTKRFTLYNIYALNKDRPNFFLEALRAISELSSELIIVGDFNLVMDPTVDRRGSLYNPQFSSATLQNICEEYGLCDIWHVRNLLVDANQTKDNGQ